MRFIERCLPAWVIGIATSFSLPMLPPWPATALIGTFLLAFAAVKRNHTATLLLVTLVGMVYGIWRTEAVLANQWPTDKAEAVFLTIKVADLPQRDDKRTRFEAEATDETGKTRHIQFSDYGLNDWPVGSVWRVKARLKAPIGEVNLRGFDREAWALSHGLNGTGTIGKGREFIRQDQAVWLLKLRSKISTNWQNVTGFENGTALMRALSIGEQNALPDEAWSTFRPLGITHLVSISGLHVSMVGLMAALLMRQVLRRLPYSFRRPRSVMLLTGVSAAFLYSLLAGFNVPTQRTVLMLAAFAWCWHAKWGRSAWFAWWTALASVLFFDPTAVLGVGTWLSFGLVAALLWVGSWRLEEKGRELFWRSEYAMLLVSIVALGWLFSALPVVSPLVNLLAVPWFSWVLVPLALMASAFPFLPVQTLAAAAGEYTMQALFWMGKYAPECGIAAPPISLLIVAIAAAMLALLPRGLGLRPLAFLILIGFMAYRPKVIPPEQLKIMVWDVGQGLAVSFHTYSKSLLFDTGTAAAAQTQLVPNLRAIGVNKLDALVLSHHDNDHDGGASVIRETFSPQTVWAGQPQFYQNVHSCRAEKTWEWDGVRFELLGLSENPTVNDNGQSCVLRVVAAQKAVLITGDLDKRGEQGLLGRYGEDLYSHVLVLGHHGSNSASSGAFLNTVSPQYGIASSGFANAYKHPSAEVRSRLHAHGIRLLRTDRQGALLIKFAQDEEMLQDDSTTWRPYWHRKPFSENKEN
ncbi:MAG: DNA internalization-related competence protein ComEC/Rec2 [Neisseria sp.]|uniref:DNA internalization-related competence protein ComEC/Rec2 n=1 Tax=Neisseria sp. TaxID=192066 RepID=UPI0026DACB9E|nr:DNA internalization-related competence protein ComEC/Rec2 [Neisseria sp.]MDO4640978.1 DNA internalization-related competence protein ComEC/Rec2 [Neisseria sp.]